MRLVAAELLKIRLRWASYLVVGILIALMALVYLFVGLGARDGGFGSSALLRFPGAYGAINQFVFGLGSLIAVAYAAAIAGADWNWGIFSVVVARGESRARYVLAKAAGLGIAIAVGVAVAYLAGIMLTSMAGAIAGATVGNPVGGSGLTDLSESLGLGYLVVAERAAIGFAVAILLRSQLAGVIVGIVLYIGEAILSTIILATTVSASIFEGELSASGPYWFQYLPFSIGDSVLAAAPSVTSDVSDLLVQPVPFGVAVTTILVYVALALGVSVLSAERSQIAGSSG